MNRLQRKRSTPTTHMITLGAAIGIIKFAQLNMATFKEVRPSNLSRYHSDYWWIFASK